MDVGVSRRSAFEDLRHRNDSEALNRLVTSLLQAEELGTPLADALQDMSGEMRRMFAQDARRRAARAAPRISLIVTTVMVPAAVLLIVATFLLGSNIHLGSVSG
jgi:tight adherence protein C